MRKFEYTTEYSKIPFLVKSYIDTLETQLEWLSKNESNELYIDAYQQIQKFKKKYPDLSEISSLILNDLLKSKNVEYAMINHKYPEDASKIGMEFSIDLNEVFKLESLVENISIKYWENDLTRFFDIQNGEDFMVVAHASYQLPGVHENANYRSGDYNKQFISCSILSNNELNTFEDSKIVYLVPVNKENYICSSKVDCVTGEIKSPDFNTVGIINDGNSSHYISAGYSFIKDEAVTKIATPRLIEKLSVEREVKETGTMFNYNTQTNEVVLDRTKTKIEGALLLSNGCDLVIDEYLQLKRNNVLFKCINRGIYRTKKNMTSFTTKEYREFINKIENIDYLLNRGYITSEDLQNYYDEVVVNMNYDEEVLEIINEAFSKYINRHY